MNAPSKLSEGLVIEIGTATSTDGEVSVTFTKKFSVPPTILFTTTGTSTSLIWGIKCKTAPTTLGFTAVTVKNQNGSNTPGSSNFTWVAIGR